MQNVKTIFPKCHKLPVIFVSGWLMLLYWAVTISFQNYKFLFKSCIFFWYFLGMNHKVFKLSHQESKIGGMLFHCPFETKFQKINICFWHNTIFLKLFSSLYTGVWCGRWLWKFLSTGCCSLSEIDRWLALPCNMHPPHYRNMCLWVSLQ